MARINPSLSAPAKCRSGLLTAIPSDQEDRDQETAPTQVGSSEAGTDQTYPSNASHRAYALANSAPTSSSSFMTCATCSFEPL